MYSSTPMDVEEYNKLLQRINRATYVPQLRDRRASRLFRSHAESVELYAEYKTNPNIIRDILEDLHDRDIAAQESSEKIIDKQRDESAARKRKLEDEDEDRHRKIRKRAHEDGIIRARGERQNVWRKITGLVLSHSDDEGSSEESVTTPTIPIPFPSAKSAARKMAFAARPKIRMLPTSDRPTRPVIPQQRRRSYYEEGPAVGGEEETKKQRAMEEEEEQKQDYQTQKERRPSVSGLSPESVRHLQQLVQTAQADTQQFDKWASVTRTELYQHGNALQRILQQFAALQSSQFDERTHTDVCEQLATLRTELAGELDLFQIQACEAEDIQRQRTFELEHRLRTITCELAVAETLLLPSDNPTVTSQMEALMQTVSTLTEQSRSVLELTVYLKHCRGILQNIPSLLIFTTETIDLDARFCRILAVIGAAPAASDMQTAGELCDSVAQQALEFQGSLIRATKYGTNFQNILEETGIPTTDDLIASITAAGNAVLRVLTWFHTAQKILRVDRVAIMESVYARQLAQIASTVQPEQGAIPVHKQPPVVVPKTQPAVVVPPPQPQRAVVEARPPPQQPPAVVVPQPRPQPVVTVQPIAAEVVPQPRPQPVVPEVIPPPRPEPVVPVVAPQPKVVPQVEVAPQPKVVPPPVVVVPEPKQQPKPTEVAKPPAQKAVVQPTYVLEDDTDDFFAEEIRAAPEVSTIAKSSRQGKSTGSEAGSKPRARTTASGSPPPGSTEATSKPLHAALAGGGSSSSHIEVPGRPTRHSNRIPRP